MGTPLTGTQAGSTYPALLKTGDNLALTTSKLLSDGLGNDAALTLGAAGGASTFSGTLTSTGNFAVGASTFTVAAANGNTVVGGTLSSAGNFAVATTRFTVAAATGNTVVAGTLNVTGACVFTATGSFGGNLSTSQTMTCRAFVQNDVAGSNSLSGSLTVGGSATFNGSAQFNSSVSFAQTATFNGGISSPTITATSTSALGSASAGSLTTTGAVNCGGNLAVNGNTTIGDAAADSLTVNAATVTTPNIPAKATPVSADRVLIRDSADSNRLKDVPFSAFAQSSYSYSAPSDVAAQLSAGTPYVQVSHGLGSTPRIALAYLECTNAYASYLTGDRIPLEGARWQTNTTEWRAIFALTVNDSNWTVAMLPYASTPVPSAGGRFYLINKLGGTNQDFEPSKWKIAVELTK